MITVSSKRSILRCFEEPDCLHMWFRAAFTLIESQVLQRFCVRNLMHLTQKVVSHRSPQSIQSICGLCYFFTAKTGTMCVFSPSLSLSSSLQKRVDQHHFPPLESCKLILWLSVVLVYIPHCFNVCLIKQKEVEREKQQHSLSTLFT